MNRRWPTRGPLLVVALVMAAGVLAGCGGGAAGSTAASTAAAASSTATVITGADGVQEVTLRTQDDYVFTPNSFTVKPGRVKLTVRNIAKELTHNFRFFPSGNPAAISAQIPILAPGQSQTITFAVQTPGAYRFECSFHVQLGQVGTMTVGG